MDPFLRVTKILCSHRRIVKYKTAYYSAYLPEIACTLLMSGENLDNHTDAKNILVEIGIYLQLQINYGKPNRKNVIAVEALYLKLDIQGAFRTYEETRYRELSVMIYERL
ncbi:hypothetical protein K1719_007242 [Acacia pycnantha]|nr:hypothetical protein K1719_007242 [Acacia pycnantha]